MRISLRLVDEADFQSSQFGIATRAWVAYQERIISFNDLVYRGVKTLTPAAVSLRMFDKIGFKINDEHKSSADKAIALARQEIDSDFEFLHGLILIASWGAFEAYVEDLCKAMLLMRRDLLETRPFDGLKVSPSILLADPNDQMEAVLSAANAKISTAPKVGVGKFEAQLGLVQLSGNDDINPELKDAVFYAQQTRNVWAHRSGKADKKFVDRCPKLGVSVGDTVKIGTEQSATYLNALLVYGLVIINRFRCQRQMTPFPAPSAVDLPFVGPYAEQWGVMSEDVDGAMRTAQAPVAHEEHPKN